MAKGLHFSPDEADIILRAMRDGARIRIGAMATYIEYSFRDGAWFTEHNDECSASEARSDEASIRRTIAREPQSFVELLRRGPWDAFKRSYAGGDFESARQWLRVVGKWGDPEQRYEMLDAVLAWPSETPRPETLELIRRRVEGHTAYHVFMSAVGWEETRKSGRRGIAYADRLAEILGAETPGGQALRATFLRMAGELHRAVAELESAIERTEESTPRELLVERLGRYREEAARGEA